MTCGLMQVGSECEDQGERLGLHGRIHHTAARQVAAVCSWREDEMEMKISGVMEETSIFGGCLHLSRQISSRLGENEIFIQDEVRNMGFQSCPHMILYHFNFGFPLLTEKTLITFKNTSVQPREIETPLNGYEEWQVPDANYQERVYYHQPQGVPEVQIINPNFPLHEGVVKVLASLKWSVDTLPRLVQWKMPGAGTHVLGIEPANCYVEGRHKEREQGTLIFLEPGETVKYELRLNLS